MIIHIYIFVAKFLNLFVLKVSSFIAINARMDIERTRPDVKNRLVILNR